MTLKHRLQFMKMSLAVIHINSFLSQKKLAQVLKL